MGLDVYAVRSPEVGLTEEDVRAFEEAGIELCGFSGNGDGFRGKVYDTLIPDITGVSLYQAWIPPETVKNMSEALNKFDIDEFARTCETKYSWEQYSADTIVNLRKFFNVCVERGLGLAGDW
jgi:hypothetical protein